MKLRKRIVALGAAMIMAVSMMSVVASATLYTNSSQLRYYDTAHNCRFEGYVYSGNKSIGAFYSEVETGGFFVWTADAYAGCESINQYALAYASVTANGNTESSENNKVSISEGISWTDDVVCATSGTTYGTRFRGHCLY